MQLNGVTRLVLIRHGESASNAGGWLSGQDTCGGLTDLGVAQAEALRTRLAADADLRPDAVLVSTMRRAVHTAEIIAAPTGLAPQQHADLMERTSGEAEGMTTAQYAVKYGKPAWSDWMNPLSPGGESGPVFSARVMSATDRVVAEHQGKTVWVVCHGGVIMVSAIRRWSAAVADFSSMPTASPANTSINEWLVDDAGHWRLARYNDHTHLVGITGGGVGEAPDPI